jgi:hypothetical protein
LRVAGWLAPDEHVEFPRPVREDAVGRTFDVDQDGRADFAMLFGPGGRIDELGYDDDEDGDFERVVPVRRSGAGPHLFLLVDSLPYVEVARRYERGEGRWFGPPIRVVPPFPSMSEVSFAAILRAPRQEGTIERYYDRAAGEIVEGYRARAFGYEHPWQRELDYHLGSYLRVGMSYLRPRAWLPAEFAGVKRAVDANRAPLTHAYVVTTSAMVSRHGRVGLEESLVALEELCARLLYEHEGALAISVVSDHGHNLEPSSNFDMRPVLARAGFRVTERLEHPRDVVLEIDGLVTYFAAHTAEPQAVAEALLPCPEVELATYREGERVLVRSRRGVAAIEERDGRLRYRALTADVLDYASVQAALGGRDGFVADDAWLAATAEHAFPDAPRRLWDAFHGLVTNTPDVLFTLHDGLCAGDPAMDRWIDMQSTHGGLGQSVSDAMLWTTLEVAGSALRSGEVLERLGIAP